ncbi:hypothetical protein AL345_14765 [Aeromonas caviae]|uniref:hypothetical protein n=1 Tax=Aeromonas caviae TaxID=648 RepID=UPI0006A5C76E|nr:hypothetical protein [Aeromonas caviae]KOG92652.1 hypothetical protein AL345_14765 [Aeromonas caviae]
MNEHVDLKLEDTKLLTLYFQELWWLARGVKTKAERLFSEATVPDTGYVMQVNADLHSLIASLLSDATNLKKLVITPDTRLRGESGPQFRLRKARALELKKVITGIELTEMLNVKIRNSLEHFDEYLDEANLSISTAKSPPAPIALYNILLSHWEVTNPRAYPIRVYVSSERKFYNMKWSVDIGKIHQESTAIVERLSAYLGFADPEGPGGMIIPLGYGKA